MSQVIEIPQAVVNGKTMPRLYISDINLIDEGSSPVPSSAYMHYFSVMTLSELYYAYHTSPQFRRSVRSTQGKGTWTSTHVKPRIQHHDELIPEGYRPVTVTNLPGTYFERIMDVYVGRSIPSATFDLLEPPEGWVIRYHPDTFYPAATSPRREDAVREFNEDASYFKGEHNRQSFVCQISDKRFGPFSILTVPDDKDHPNVGARNCRREINTKLSENHTKAGITSIIETSNDEHIPRKITDEYLYGLIDAQSIRMGQGRRRLL